jgi:hypothetical protein
VTTTLPLVLLLLVVLVTVGYLKIRQSGVLRDDSEDRLAAALGPVLPTAPAAPEAAPPPQDVGSGAVQLVVSVPAGSALDGERLAARIEARAGARTMCSGSGSAFTVQSGKMRARVQLAPGSSMVGRLARAGALEARERRAVVESPAVLLVDRVGGDPSAVERARFATHVLAAALDLCSSDESPS